LNILFIADPNSIHDIRWMHSLIAKGNISGFVLARKPHYESHKLNPNTLSPNIKLLSGILDPSVIRPFRNLVQAFKIRNMIRRHKIDIVHIMYAEPNALWANWKSLFNVPLILTTRGTDVLKTIPEFFQKKSLLASIVASRYRSAFNSFDHITCTSQRQLDGLKSMKVNTPATLVRTGVDIQKIKRAVTDMKARLGITEKFVLMPRNMRPLYNHEFTLDAIGLLEENFLREYSFVFINSDTKDSAYLSSIKQKAASIKGKFHFLSSFEHEEMLSLYKQASLIVMNPLSDGSPVSAMEAMASNVPVILPPLTLDMEIFEGAFVFDQWTPQSLKTKIEYVLSFNARELGEILASIGARVSSVADSEAEMRKVSDIYKRLKPLG
jgi:glycosyltransferase involved in cell wall biosynthesis